MEISAEILAAILDGYPYEVVFADRNHVKIGRAHV